MMMMKNSDFGILEHFPYAITVTVDWGSLYKLLMFVNTSICFKC